MQDFELFYWNIKEEEDDPDDPRIIQRDLLEPSYKCAPKSRRRRAMLNFYCMTLLLLAIVVLVGVAIYLSKRI